VKGHIIKLSYSPFGALTLSGTLFHTTLIDEVGGISDEPMNRLQIDALWKF
jgi:hypothetical protein